MKKLQTMLAAAALLFATSAIAARGPEKVSRAVKTAFEKQFTAASNVSWQKSGDHYFASFKLNQQEVSAAYNEEGELVGTSRVMNMEDLPLAVSLAVAEKYRNWTVSDTATEVTYDGSVSYCITVENNKQVLSLKCQANGDIDVMSKTKK